ncbi:ribosome biogenesis GTP-binding protein YihA/YsxC [Metallumcola ferriviriculae]|uniref:Probable GTP-binding protein EngB n=1 Tax=Metallumcola ferriviriculae TaxID=3039180 RepID=A0AAU0UL15_9FIRM|nr:ribosome biogenesis GTP-binding protein YihA/YsxC [Desulfitibacteraceae bacterium MK1]
MMRIKKAEFIKSALKPEHYPQEVIPEVAFSGRSNVGKSSMFNQLVGQKSLARVSRQPGRTQTINFFLVNNSFHMVDLPGYGFAKVPLKVKAQWGKMMETYLGKRQQLRGVVLLLDIRHKPTGDDRQMLDWLIDNKLPVIVVATKSDKISKGRRQHHLAVIKKELALSPEQQIVQFSSQTGEGKELLLSGVEALINE